MEENTQVLAGDLQRKEKVIEALLRGGAALPELPVAQGSSAKRKGSIAAVFGSAKSAMSKFGSFPGSSSASSTGADVFFVVVLALLFGLTRRKRQSSSGHDC